MPGEHDASLDSGKAFKEFFGADALHVRPQGRAFHRARQRLRSRGARSATSSSRGSRPTSTQQPKDAHIVVFTHRPLFDLYPQWDWATRDGAQGDRRCCMPHANVTVFYGHIHQEHHHMTGHIAHHAAKSLMFPLPAPGSQPKRTPLPWDPAQPYKGLGFRERRGGSATREVRDHRIAGA